MPWGGVAHSFPVATAGAALLLLCATLAGCNGLDGDTSSTSSQSFPSSTGISTGISTAPPLPDFDGDAALEFVRGFVLQADGTPRFRIPGTVGQQEGAAYLWSQTDLPGWTRGWQNFTGEDYLLLNRSVVAGYGQGSLPCSLKAEAVPALPFHNLYALRAAGGAYPEPPLLLLAAHWDSQMHSDFDPDESKRCLPDPGANDGASGVGLLLQMMRELEGVDLPFRVGVLFIDGEDGFFDHYPLAGALYFAQNPPFGVDRFLLLDMVGDPGARYIREAASAQSDPKMLDLLWRHGRALGGGDSFVQRSYSITDDHVAFIAAGIPSVDVIDAGRDATGFPPQWDTTEDTVEKLSPTMLALVGDTILATVQDPTFVQGWPGLSGP